MRRDEGQQGLSGRTRCVRPALWFPWGGAGGCSGGWAVMQGSAVELRRQKCARGCAQAAWAGRSTAVRASKGLCGGFAFVAVAPPTRVHVVVHLLPDFVSLLIVLVVLSVGEHARIVDEVALRQACGEEVQRTKENRDLGCFGEEKTQKSTPKDITARAGIHARRRIAGCEGCRGTHSAQSRLLLSLAPLVVALSLAELILRGARAPHDV